MLASFHSQFWDGEEGGGGEPQLSSGPSGYGMWQAAILIDGACALLLMISGW